MPLSQAPSAFNTASFAAKRAAKDQRNIVMQFQFGRSENALQKSLAPALDKAFDTGYLNNIYANVLQVIYLLFYRKIIVSFLINRRVVSVRCIFGYRVSNDLAGSSG